MDRMSKDGRVKVTWFYRPEEAVGGRKGFHGLQELFGSDHGDVVHKDTILQKVMVYTLEEYEALEEVLPHQYFTRFFYKPATTEFVPDKVPVYCTCELPYNPDRDMVLCDECEDWYHWDCLAIKDERELDAVHHFVCPPCIKSAASSAARHTREQAAPPQHNGDSSPPTLLFNPTHYHSTMGHDASFTQHGL
ncbi:MAG: hypothetical protein WDW36_007996 [Sanguina aurantia]